LTKDNHNHYTYSKEYLGAAFPLIIETD